MQLNTEGGSPSLRAQLGTGWNRALPAPFAFSNCVLPDGVNDKLTVPALIGTTYNTRKTFSFEFWVNLTTALGASNGNLLAMNFSDGGQVFIEYINAGGSNFRYITQNGAFTLENKQNLIANFDTLTGIQHVVVLVDMVNLQIQAYNNGTLQTTGTLNAQATEATNNPTISTLDFLLRSGTPWARKIDEVRIYNRIISQSEIVSNYNLGVGNNPAKTEGLVLWYDFEQAESDTALNPSGNPTGWTSGAWGIRDKTQNANHAMQVNFSANNATLGGAIQAF